MTKEQRIEKFKADILENEAERFSIILMLEQIQADFYKELYKLDRKSDKLCDKLAKAGFDVLSVMN